MYRKAVILADTRVQDEEYLYPYYRLQEANFETHVASSSTQPVFGKYGIPIKTTMHTSELQAKDFDLVIVPGGMESPEKIRRDSYALKFLQDMDAAKKTIGAICHGPWVLVSAKIVKDRHMTCFQGMCDDLINAGGIYEDKSLVIDKNIVTAPHYRHNPEFMKNVLEVYESYLLSNLVLA